MDRWEMRAAVAALPVFDTHAHLCGGRLAARDFWEIGEYSWFHRELTAAGYPAKADSLPEEKRIEAWAKAFAATGNTTLHWVVKAIFRDLYGIDLQDTAKDAAALHKAVAAVHEAVAAVRASAEKPDWAAEVAAKTGLHRVVVNETGEHPFPELPGMAIWVPRVENRIRRAAEQAEAKSDQRRAIEEAAESLAELVREAAEQGSPAIMTTLPRLEGRANETPVLRQSGHSRDQLMFALLHKLCAAVEAHGLCLQLFLGVEKDWSTRTTPANDPNRVLQLHGLFDRYACRFELVLGADMNNADAVQAAWNFPNVDVGGMWWFNFRASTYRDSMQKRLEALPPAKSSLIVSDARCIEWCYGKVLLVKRLLADFLFDQIELGWLDEDLALHVAGQWLHDSAAVRYQCQGS